MAFEDNMVPAQEGGTASSAEYNKVVSNVRWVHQVNQNQDAWITQHLGGVDDLEATHDVINQRLDALEGGGSSTAFGSFYQGTSQSIQRNSTSPTTNRLVWDSQTETPNGVSRSDGNRTITLNRAGIWVISVFARFEGQFNANRIVSWLGPPDSGTSERYGFSMIQPTTTLLQPGVSLSITKRVTSGCQFSAYLFQDSDTNRDTLTSYQSTALTCTFLGA